MTGWSREMCIETHISTSVQLGSSTVSIWGKKIEGALVVGAG